MGGSDHLLAPLGRLEGKPTLSNQLLLPSLLFLHTFLPPTNPASPPMVLSRCWCPGAAAPGPPGERGLLHLFWVQRLTNGTAAPQEPLDLESRPASLPQLVRGWRRRRERRREAGPKPQDRKEQEPAPPDLLHFSRGETLRRCPGDPDSYVTRPPSIRCSFTYPDPLLGQRFKAKIEGQLHGGGVPPVPLPPYPRMPNLLPTKAGEAASPPPPAAGLPLWRGAG